MKQRISAGCLVVHEGRILLVHHRSQGREDFWICPGGGVVEDETLEAAAEREVFEETGLIVHAHTLVYIGDTIDRSGRAIKFWYLADLVAGDLPKGEFRCNDPSIIGAAWFTQGQLPDGMIFPREVRGRLWRDIETRLSHPILLPTEKSVV